MAYFEQGGRHIITVPRCDRFVAIDRAECWLHLQIRYPIVIVATTHEWLDITPASDNQIISRLDAAIAANLRELGYQ